MVALITMQEKLPEELKKGVRPHWKRHQQPSLYVHSIKTGHQTLEIITELSEMDMGMKIAEALLIKELKPTLNKQDKSIPLKLFN